MRSQPDDPEPGVEEARPLVIDASTSVACRFRDWQTFCETAVENFGEVPVMCYVQVEIAEQDSR